MDSDFAAIPSSVSTAVNSAVSALVKYKAKQQSSTDKLQLLPQDDYLYLNLTLKKIPNKSRTNPFRIALPHPILDTTSELCLIIDDRANTPTPPSDQIKKLIKSQEIPISKVLKLSKLKANYKAFEAKRKLCDSYDMFLVDKKIVHLLPKLLGKEFFKKKKLPLGVDLGKKSFKAQVERALGSALLYLRTGTCSVMKVGKAEMEEGEIVENVVEAVKGAVENVPRKWDGVRSLHLKFSDSVALPVYQAMPDVKLKVEEEGKGKSEVVVAKVSDSEGEAQVGKSGKVKKRKGRIHEVKYMDVGDGIDDSDDIVEGVELIDEDLDVAENVGKKRKAGKKDKKKKVEEEESVAKKPKKTELADGGADTAEKKRKKKKKKNEEVARANAMSEPLETVHKKGKKKIENEVEEKKGKKKSMVEDQIIEFNSGKKAKKGGVEVVKELESGEKKSNKKKSKAEKVNELKSGEKKHADKKKSEVEEVNALKSGEEKKSNKKKRELGDEITESKSGEKKAKKKSKKEIDEPVTEVKVAKQKKRVSTK